MFLAECVVILRLLLSVIILCWLPLVSHVCHSLRSVFYFRCFRECNAIDAKHRVDKVRITARTVPNSGREGPLGPFAGCCVRLLRPFSNAVV